MCAHLQTVCVPLPGFVLTFQNNCQQVKRRRCDLPTAFFCQMRQAVTCIKQHRRDLDQQQQLPHAINNLTNKLLMYY